MRTLCLVLSVLLLSAGCAKQDEGQEQAADTREPEARVITPDGREPEVISNSIGMKLVLIPAGEFMMGSPDDEEGRNSDEGPVHEVRITKPFYLGMYEVTQEQYETVMGENPSRFKGPRRPVESVSWDDAVEFCRKLSAKEGRKYRLPTEAEWEYACRAGSTTRWCFGSDDSDLGEYAWYCGNSENTTHLVGQKKPNAWGLHDMHGNVWEWCQDWHEGEYWENSPREDPTGPTTGSYRVDRGGGWGSIPRNWRSASRGRRAPDTRSGNLGFRVASVPVDASGR